MDELLKAARVRDAIRAAAKRANIISEEHLHMYERMQVNYGVIRGAGVRVANAPQLIAEYAQRLDQAGIANFMRPEELGQRYTMFASPAARPSQPGVDPTTQYRMDLTQETMAQVGHAWAQLKEHYIQLQDVAAQLDVLEQKLATAQTPEQRRDVQINLDLTRARYDILDGMVKTAQLNMEAALAAKKLDEEAQGLAIQARSKQAWEDAAAVFTRQQ